MLIWILLGVFLVSLLIPFGQLIKYYNSYGKWKFNLLRTTYGNLSGIMLMGSIYTGWQHIGTGSPDFTTSIYLSIFLLISASVDIFRGKDHSEQLRRLSFYSNLFLGLVFLIMSLGLQLF